MLQFSFFVVLINGWFVFVFFMSRSIMLLRFYRNNYMLSQYNTLEMFDDLFHTDFVCILGFAFAFCIFWIGWIFWVLSFRCVHLHCFVINLVLIFLRECFAYPCAALRSNVYVYYGISFDVNVYIYIYTYKYICTQFF